MVWKKSFILLGLLFFIGLIFPSRAYAQACASTPGFSLQCCTPLPDGSPDLTDCVCSATYCVPSRIAVQCYRGHCTPDMCRAVRKDMETSVTYVAVFKACVDFGQFLNLGLSWAVVLGGLGSLFRLSIGTFKYIWSTGDPTKVEEARATIVYAVLGLIIIGIAYAILRLGSDFIPDEWQAWFGVS